MQVVLIAFLTNDGNHRRQFVWSTREVQATQRPDDSYITTNLTSVVSRSAFFSSLLCCPTLALASKLPATIYSPNEAYGLTTKSAKTTTARDESISGFLAGAALAAAKTVVKYPLDTATVRLQIRNSTYSILNPVELFTGSYKGIIPPLIANVPGGAVFFAVKDACKATLANTFPNVPRFALTMAAVAIAQIPYWLVRNPSEVVKTRQQAKLDGYYGDNVSIIDAYRRVIDDAMREQEEKTYNQLPERAKSFYTGYIENILYAYPADVVKFISYEQITKGRKNLSAAEASVAGAISTAFAQLITTPLDVVRNRLMTNVNRKKYDLQSSYVDTIVSIGKVEGLSGLFAGATPRVGKALVSGAIQFATYEETKRDILKHFESK